MISEIFRRLKNAWLAFIDSPYQYKEVKKRVKSFTVEVDDIVSAPPNKSDTITFKKFKEKE